MRKPAISFRLFCDYKAGEFHVQHRLWGKWSHAETYTDEDAARARVAGLGRAGYPVRKERRCGKGK
jgi:hypothetical protein